MKVILFYENGEKEVVETKLGLAFKVSDLTKEKVDGLYIAKNRKDAELALNDVLSIWEGKNG